MPPPRRTRGVTDRLPGARRDMDRRRRTCAGGPCRHCRSVQPPAANANIMGRTDGAAKTLTRVERSRGESPVATLTLEQAVRIADATLKRGRAAGYKPLTVPVLDARGKGK